MGPLECNNDSKQDLNDSGCVQDDSMSNGYRGQAELLDLSDDVLLYILKLCTPMDLKALGHTCPRFGALICDRTLWQRVDARSTPTGQERLRWYLTHCLSSGTQELKLSGYVNKNTKCLGIQDLTWPLSSESGVPLGPGGDAEHFLLRMWYSHLPRYSMSPRWPDKREAAGKAYLKRANAGRQHLSPLSDLASEIVVGTSSASANNISDLSNPGRSSSNAGANSSDPLPSTSNSAGTSSGSGLNSSNSAGTSSGSGLNSSNSAETSSDPGPSSSNSAGTSSVSGPNSSNSAGTSSGSGPNSSNSAGTLSDSDPSSGTSAPGWSEFSSPGDNDPKDEVDDILSGCRGPQFTLNRHLLKSLRVRCRNLSSLSLEYCNLDYRNANLRYFPPKLKKLSLKGTRCYNLPLSTSYLGKIQDRLPELEVLDISECDWLEPASLMPLSKVKNLQELYMRNCSRLTECVAYASLATRYGFQKLRIIDLRGSPVADSEVSALGWLPLLEELYVSPPEAIRTISEHSHKWDAVMTPYTELEPWESEEPDYYKCKSPNPEPMEEDEEVKEDGEVVPEERMGDVMIGDYITCTSLQRRIIVIHPNRLNQNENNQNNNEQPPQARDPPNPEPQPADPQPGPSKPQLKRRYPYKVLDLVKRKRDNDGGTSKETGEVENCSSTNDEPEQSRPDSPEYTRPNFPEISRPTNPDSSRPNIPESSRFNNPGSSRSSNPETMDSDPTNDRPSTASAGQDGKDTRDGNQASSSDYNDGQSFRIGSTEVLVRRVPAPASPTRPPEAHANPEGPEPRHRDNVRQFLDKCFDRLENMVRDIRPPLAVHARPIQERPNMDVGRSFNAVICEFPERRRRGCPGLGRPRLPRTISSDLLHFSRNLISDSSVFRFGRAVNDNVNYIHIGHNFHANDPGVRPDRSNLRVLSITGYDNITDRSLEHLATAAPHLRHIDFSYSGVTSRGVEVFKAMRPNCEVVFNKYDDVD